MSCDLTFLPWRPRFKLCQQLQSEIYRRVCPHRQFCLKGSRAEAAKGDRTKGSHSVGVIPGQVPLQGWAARLYTPGAVLSTARHGLFPLALPVFGSVCGLKLGVHKDRARLLRFPACLAAPQQWLGAQVGHRMGEAPEAGQQGSCWPLHFLQDWGWKAMLTTGCLFSQSRHQRQLPCSGQSTKKGNK